MKIGIISDTHGDVVQVEKALDILKDCDRIIHVGDVLYHGPRNDLPKNYNPKELAELLSKRDDIYYIRGNCDSDVDQMVIGHDLTKKEQLFKFDDIVIYAVHGYEETEEERIQRAKEKNAKIVLTGHTHVKVLEEKNGVILLNPGSTTIPKDGSASIAAITDHEINLINLETKETIKSLKY